MTLTNTSRVLQASENSELFTCLEILNGSILLDLLVDQLFSKKIFFNFYFDLGVARASIRQAMVVQLPPSCGRQKVELFSVFNLSFFRFLQYGY